MGAWPFADRRALLPVSRLVYFTDILPLSFPQVKESGTSVRLADDRKRCRNNLRFCDLTAGHFCQLVGLDVKQHGPASILVDHDQLNALFVVDNLLELQLEPSRLIGQWVDHAFIKKLGRTVIAHIQR